MQFDPNVVKAAVAEGQERHTEMIDTIKALKGQPYATAVTAIVRLTYSINSLADLANAGAVHPDAVPQVAALIETMQQATSVLSVMADTTKPAPGAEPEPMRTAYLDALAADVQALLDVAYEARAKVIRSAS